MYSPVTIANMREKADADSSAEPSRPTTRMEDVWIKFWRA